MHGKAIPNLSVYDFGGQTENRTYNTTEVKLKLNSLANQVLRLHKYISLPSKPGPAKRAGRLMFEGKYIKHSDARTTLTRSSYHRWDGCTPCPDCRWGLFWSNSFEHRLSPTACKLGFFHFWHFFTFGFFGVLLCTFCFWHLAFEVFSRATTSSEVLSLNLTALIILGILKVMTHCDKPWSSVKTTYYGSYMSYIWHIWHISHIYVISGGCDCFWIVWRALQHQQICSRTLLTGDQHDDSDDEYMNVIEVENGDT